jgi:outer membrane murein-binding lipoprotein Lpp
MVLLSIKRPSDGMDTISVKTCKLIFVVEEVLLAGTRNQNTKHQTLATQHSTLNTKRKTLSHLSQKLQTHLG